MIPWLSGGRVDAVDAKLKFNEDADSDVVVVVLVVALFFGSEVLHAVELVQQQVLDALGAFPLQGVR